MKYKYEEIAPCIFLYENVLNNSEELIDLAFKENNWSKAKIGKKNLVDSSVREVETHYIAPIFKNDKRWFELSQTIWGYGNEYGVANNIGFSNMEHPEFLWYKPSEGFYKEHADQGPGNFRIFSAVLYLNDVEDGGETYFRKFDVGVKPKKNRLVIFPANYAYVHEARRTTNSDKFVVVTWFNS